MNKILGLLIPPILGIALFASATSIFHLGVAPDSISYMSVAQHIAHGKGVQVYMPNYRDHSEPVAGWSPGFPLLLAIFVLLKIPLIDSTWLVSLALFGLNIFIVSVIIWRYSKNYLLAFLTGLVLTMEQSWHHYHSYILSEPLNLLLVNLAVLTLWIATEKRRNGWLMVSILLTGAATLTRYISVAHAMAGALALLLFWNGNFRQRLKKGILFGFFSLLPFLGWSIRNVLLTGKPGESIQRSAYGTLIHEDSPTFNTIAENTLQFFRLIGIWAGEFLGTGWLTGLVILGAFFLILILTKKIQRPLPAILAIHLFCYVAALVVVLRVVRFAVPIPERYLMTQLCHLFLLSVIGGYEFYRYCIARSPRFRVPILSALIVCFLLVAWHRGSETLRWHNRLMNDGPDGSWGMRWGFVERLPWLPEK